MAGRISQLNDPEFARAVAELYIRGVSRKEMAEQLMASERSITIWVKDPRVQAHARSMAIERVQMITRRIDGEIEARLAHVDDWDLDELLKVRKEFLDRPLKSFEGSDVDTGKVSNELTEAMDQSPEFAQQLKELVEAASDKE